MDKLKFNFFLNLDNTAPNFTCPGTITQNTTQGLNSSVIEFTLDPIDNVDPNPTVSCSHASGNTFYVGSTKVNCNISDFSNNVEIEN